MKQTYIKTDAPHGHESDIVVNEQEVNRNVPTEFEFVKLLTGLTWMLPLFGVLVHAVGYGKIDALCSTLGFNMDLFEVSTSRHILDGYLALIWTTSNIALIAMTKDFVFAFLGFFVLTVLYVLGVVWVRYRFGDELRLRLSKVSRSTRTGSALIIASAITWLGIFGLLVMLPFVIALPILIGKAVGTEQAKLYLTQPQDLIMQRAALANGELQCSGVLIIANDKNRGWLDMRTKTGCVESSDGKFIGKWNLPERHFLGSTKKIEK